MKRILFFAAVLLTYFSFSQDIPEGGCGPCITYSLEVKRAELHATLPTYHLFSVGPNHGDHGMFTHPEYIAQQTITIRTGDHVQVMYKPCQGEPAIDYTFHPDEAAIVFLEGGAVDEDVIGQAPYSGLIRNLQFMKDAKFLVPTFNLETELTGEYYLINVDVVFEDEQEAPEVLFNPTPFVYQENNVVYIRSKIDGLGKLSVVNSGGKVLQIIEIEENAKVDLSPYERGIYIFIVEKNGIVTRGKAVRL